MRYASTALNYAILGFKIGKMITYVQSVVSLKVIINCHVRFCELPVVSLT